MKGIIKIKKHEIIEVLIIKNFFKDSKKPESLRVPIPNLFKISEGVPA